jgi:uncharacterized protein YbjT (DUF2867 family)
MAAQTAVVIGASGLVGSHVVQQLLADDAFNKVRVLVRKPLAIQHPKLEQQIADFSNYNEYQTKLGKGDCIFCCIGTTNAKVKGNKALYRTIDFDIPVNAARFGSEAGFKHYLLVSAMGANSSSRIFYSRLKGEVEEVIGTFPYQSFHVFRPSFLLGKRTEQRLGESIGKAISKLFSFLIPSNYKPIEAATVAKAMVTAAKQQKSGFAVHNYREMTGN